MKTRTDLTSSWWNFPLNESVLKFTEKEGRSESEKTGSALPDQSTVRKLERNLKPKGTGDQELPEVKFSLPNGRSLSWDKRLWRQPVRVWGLFSLSTWHGIHVYPVTNLVSGGPRLVTYLAICDRLCHSHGAAPRRGAGTIAIWPPTIHSPCS